MISEIVLGLIVLALLIDKFMYSREMNKQIRELSKLIKSKDAIEYATVSKMEAKTVDVPRPTLDVVPTESLSDEDFFKAIGKQLNAKQE